MILLNYVLPRYAGKGVGTMLLKHIESKAFRIGMNELFADSTKSALKFYLSKGFSCNGEPICSNGKIISYPLVKKIGSQI